MKRRHSKIQNRLLVWYIIGSLVPLIFLSVAVIFYLAPVSSWSELLELIQRTLIIPLLASFILILTLSIIIPKEITKPIRKLQAAVDKMLKGDKNIAVDVNTNDELADLAEGFNRMTAEVTKARAGLEMDIKNRTEALLKSNNELQDSKTAMLNILEDAEAEKIKAEEQRAKIEAIITSIADGVIVVDKKADILLINERAKKLLNITDKVIGEYVCKAVKLYADDGSEIKLAIDKFLDSNKSLEVFDRALADKNTEQYLEINLSKYRNINQEIVGAIIVVRDITRNVEIDKMKSEFASVASHQLRTPLSAVRWLLEMLLGGDLGKLNKEQQEAIQDALESNSRMIYLVNDLLNVSRLESAKIKVEPVLCSLNQLLKTALKEGSVLAKEKSIKLNKVGIQEVPKIKLDKSLMGQILQNLISNAIKYSPNNSEVKISLEVIEDSVQFAVRDSGYGIPKEEQPRIFEKFFRAENVTRMETEGTGLGLYISKMVMELSGGKIWFESEEKKGSTFYFSIPLSGSKAKEGSRSLAHINS